jgi:hypothetical protein
MTCAGLIGLAVNYGMKLEAGKKPTAPEKDPVVKTALKALGASIDSPRGEKWREQAPQFGRNGGFGRVYYFLWSLERMAMIYNLKTIGKKDWYQWGAEVLLVNQGEDGSWRGMYGEFGADTAFAILFLKRANLAQDLTAKLRGKTSDPGEAVLRGGGVGGEALMAKERMKKAIDPKDRASSRDNRPRARPEPVAVKGTPGELASRLVKGTSRERQAALEDLRTGKGNGYTLGLAWAIPKLNMEGRKKARATLVERLRAMTAKTLRGWLKYDDPEIQRAAALACAAKTDRSLIPDLFAVLKECDDDGTVKGIRAALRTLARQDFGPGDATSKEERDLAFQQWQKWWESQGKK